MPDIYDEAIADKKRLLQAAEQTAKKKLMEAVEPRIKELVESALLGKLDEDFADDDVDVLAGIVDVSDGSLDGSDADMQDDQYLGMLDAEQSVEDPMLSSEEQATMTLPQDNGNIVLDLDGVVAGASAVDNSQSFSDYRLTPESVRALESLIGLKETFNQDAADARIARLESTTLTLENKKKLNTRQLELVKQSKLECQRLYNDLQRRAGSLDESFSVDANARLNAVFNTLTQKYSQFTHLKQIVNEMVNVNKKAGTLSFKMSSNKNTTKDELNECILLMRDVFSLHEAIKRLHSQPKLDESVDKISIEKVGSNLNRLYTEIKKMLQKKKLHEMDDLDVGVDDASDDVEKMLVQLELPASLSDIAAGDQVSVVDVSPADAVDDDMGEAGLEGLDAPVDAELGGDDVDTDVDVDDVDLSDMGALDDADEDDLGEGIEESFLNDDDIIELEEAALVAEMKRMKKLREKKSALSHGGHGPGDLSDFGGGKDEGEKFVDGQEMNQSDPSGSEGYLEEADSDEDFSDVEDDEIDAALSDLDVSESFTENVANGYKRTGKKASSKEKQLAETVKLVREELNAQKLFNTKLIALNRILQLPGLKKEHKSRVVKILDEAKSLKETQELYKKIVSSINKQSKAKSHVNESARPAAGGSRVLTSSSPKQGSEESHPMLERWSKIAGLVE